MSQKNGGMGAPPKYIADFSKALASEVRILLAEVGKLRDERRALQYEIAELMSVKSKHGAGGEYSPEWKPQQPEAPPEEAPPPAMIEDIAPARPAWRTVYKRPERRIKGASHGGGPPVSSPTPPPPPMPAPSMAPNMPAWAQWRPNPLLSPAPVHATSAQPLPSTPAIRSGLFGPSTPPPMK